MLRTVCPAVVVAIIILFVPKLTERVFVLLLLNTPTVKSAPPKSIVPATKNTADVAV